MKKKHFLLAAGVSLAMAFTFSCSDDGEGDNPSGWCAFEKDESTLCAEIGGSIAIDGFGSYKKGDSFTGDMCTALVNKNGGPGISEKKPDNCDATLTE